ncbi:MAG: XdhC family protein [Bacillota bacterium]|nr:XdhC family protein [Bacillota bacterium]MDP4159463.1 XdhC family protein [Bacillota bacterium]
MDSKVLDEVMHLENDEQTAIATIISTRGSTPRKSGSQALFYRDGRTVGTIGGGCGEAEAKRLALMVMESGIPIVVEVNLTHDVAEADGMVCGGVMEIFIEPLKLSRN